MCCTFWVSSLNWMTDSLFVPKFGIVATINIIHVTMTSDHCSGQLLSFVSLLKKMTKIKHKNCYIKKWVLLSSSRTVGLYQCLNQGNYHSNHCRHTLYLPSWPYYFVIFTKTFFFLTKYTKGNFSTEWQKCLTCVIICII